MNLLGSSNILDFLSSFGIAIIQTYSEIFNWFTYSVSFPGGFRFTVFEIIFTSGLTFFLGTVIFKWIKDFII